MKQTKVGIAGLGAIGGAVARALVAGIDGYAFVAASDLGGSGAFDVPAMGFEELAKRCDLVVECLPPDAAAELSEPVLRHGKDLIMISASALLIHKTILKQHRTSKSRIIVPSGALIGIDGVSALAQLGITSAKIATTKPPMGYKNAPFVETNMLDLEGVTEKTMIFSGNALEAAMAFPANVNVAATLSLAGIGASLTQVEIWADPNVSTNSHEITVESEYSRMVARVENRPDPANPKSSMLAAQSIVSVLKGLSAPLVVL